MDTLAAYMQQESPSQLNNAAWKPTFRTSPSLPSSSSCSSPVVVASNTKGRKIGAKSRRLARLPRGLPLPNASGAQAVEVNLAANAARTGGSVPIELDPQRLLDLHREPLPLTQHQALLGGGSSLSVSPLLSPAPPGSSSSAQVSEFSFSTAHAHESSCAEQTVRDSNIAISLCFGVHFGHHMDRCVVNRSKAAKSPQCWTSRSCYRNSSVPSPTRILALPKLEVHCLWFERTHRRLIM